MKIIYTTAEDFIQQEIAEYGHDYVEHQFDLGYEPGLVTAMGENFYTWVKAENVLQLSKTDIHGSHNNSRSVSFNSVSMGDAGEGLLVR